MSEGLKLLVTADIKQAQKSLKGFVNEAGASGKAAGTALGKGLNSVAPAIEKIPKAARPAAQAISKLGTSLNQLKFAVLDRKEELIRTSDIKRAAVLNAEIKQLQQEIIKVQTVGAGGLNLGGVGQVATKGFSALRQAAFILPGIGIAGILGGITDALGSLFFSADKTNEKIKELVKSTSEIKITAAAGTEGEAAKVRALAAVVLDQTKAYDQRNRALNELKNINKNYFGDLTLEAGSLAKLTGLVNEYTAAIIQQAVIKQFSEEIANVSVEISKQIPLMGKAGAELKKFERRAGSLNGDDFFFNNIEVGDARAKFNKLGADLGQLTKQGKDLRNALNAAVLESLKFKPLDDPGSGAKKKTDDIIAQAKRLASFLDRNTQFEVKFEVDETISEEANKKAARSFIEKARSFIENQTPEFKFKPLLRTEFKFINDGKFLQMIRDQAGIEATKSYSELKKEFEDNIKRLAENNPLIIKTNAEIKAAIKKQDSRDAFDRNSFGIQESPKDENGNELFTTAELNARKFASTLTGIVAPALDSVFEAIKAGKNPLEAFFDSIGKSVQQLIVQLIQAAIKALILQALVPGVGGTKSAAGIFRGLIGFASGGLVTGPQLALIGEGSGTSRSNPEVVAPLDQLRGMLAGLAPQQQANGRLTASIRGNTILLSNNRTNRSNRRLGAR